MDLGLSGLQLLGGVASGYAGDAPEDRRVQVEETSNTQILEFVCPVHMEVVEFGAVIVEDFIAQATDPVVSLKKATTLGGTETSLKALTLGSSNAAGLTKGNGDGFSTVQYPKDNQTAIAADTDLDTGDVVHADLSSVARKFAPGEVLIIEHTTAATGAGGAYVPFVLVKVSGPDYTASNVWRELRTGEVVGD